MLFRSEKLNAKGVAASRRFISKNYGKSLVFPSISKFRQFLNIDFVKNSAYEILDTENKVIDMVERYANFEDIICCDLETEGLGVRYNVPNAHRTVTYQFSFEDHQSLCMSILLPSALLITMPSAISMIPLLMPCSSSPVPASCISKKKSTIE